MWHLHTCKRFQHCENTIQKWRVEKSNLLEPEDTHTSISSTKEI